MRYDWDDAEPAPGWKDGLFLLASHQDQVKTLPPGASLLATSEFCPVAAYRIGRQVLCVQAHPEFTEPYISYLLEKRRASIGDARVDGLLADLAHGHDGEAFARLVADFV
jgi:GMP synthase-like glutamine amidotransferase